MTNEERLMDFDKRRGKLFEAEKELKREELRFIKTLFGDHVCAVENYMFFHDSVTIFVRDDDEMSHKYEIPYDILNSENPLVNFYRHAEKQMTEQKRAYYLREIDRLNELLRNLG